MSDEQRRAGFFDVLMGQELYRTEDEYGPIIVYRRGERHIMGFGSHLEQSCVIMSRPWYLIHEYTRIMLLGLVFIEPRHVLVLGLGGGGLAHCLQHFYPAIRKTFVELRQKVIDTASAWFDLPDAKALKIICADAFDYVAKQADASVELIMSDLYEAAGMSEVQAQLGFIEQCARSLSDDGWLVLNFHQLPEDGSPLMKAIRESFDTLYVCDVYSGNHVLFCGRRPPVYDESELNDRAKRLAKQTDMPLLYYFKQLQNVSRER